MFSQFTSFNDQAGSAIPDIRLVIVRHGERIDTKYGNKWYQNSHTWGDIYAWPQKRLNIDDYILDPPITKIGARKASEVGKILRNSNNFTFDFCFSSPALRCVQTIKCILHGYSAFSNKPHVYICKDLYECYGWMGGPLVNPNFLTENEWKAAGLPSSAFHSTPNFPGMEYISKAFSKIIKNPSVNAPTNEDELSYYKRSARQINEIISFVDLSPKRSESTINCLILGHAPTAEVLTSHLLNIKPNINVLNYMSNHVNFLCMVIAERRNGIWSLSNSPLVGTSVNMMQRK
ncbi:hypothetical protein GJ496_002685 [Pomphorhynchus laevis]|nr:hypothetical protein GJ496_002685 [Pomphorhynchus laevis]